MRRASPLTFLFPGWFTIVMGLCGLAVAWQRAAPWLGGAAGGVMQALVGLATLVFVTLAALSVWRAGWHTQAWLDDLAHPVRHAFVATMPVSVLLLAAGWVSLAGPGTLALSVWRAGALAQLGVTLWVVTRGVRQAVHHTWSWQGVTPALFIPIVGNVVAPLAGVPLGEAAWSAAQFGLGIAMWPVVLALLLGRLAFAGGLPERLAPIWCVAVSPAAAGGLGALQLGVPLGVGWGMWGVAAFTLAALAGALGMRVARLPFDLPHWALSFPLASFAALTLQLAQTPGSIPAPAWAGPLGLAALAGISALIALLAAATVRGLVSGRLLAPEPAQPAPPLVP